MQVFFSSDTQVIDSNGYIVVLGTGGTIAGLANSSADHVGYRAGEVAVEDLIGDLAASVPTPHGVGVQVRCVQVAQIDSKDADWSFLWSLAASTCQALAQPTCQGVVITHGTDTLEETAWFLACVLGDQVLHKPVVLTCAMRPATALVADGPQNVVDALTLVANSGARGVQVCVAGVSWSAHSVQKVHPYRLNAFDGADAGPIAYVEAGRIRPVVSRAALIHAYPYHAAKAFLSAVVAGHPPPRQPWVELLVHTSAANERIVDVLCGAGVEGLVVQATGNGTINNQWTQSLNACLRDGLPVWCATRCQSGHLEVGVLSEPQTDARVGLTATPATLMTQAGLPFVPGLSGMKARISMMLWSLGDAA